MDPAPFLASLGSDVSVIAGALAEHPDAAVPHCPGWAVADLARHHGSVMRWAAAVVRTGERFELDSDGPADLAGSPLAAWYTAAIDPLMAELVAADPDRPCWTFLGTPRTVDFWVRRQALEAAVHRWDAQRAVGTPAGFPPEIPRAGVDEVIDEFFPRQVRLGRTEPLAGRIELQSSDDETVWLLQDGGAEETVTVRGRLEDLLLWLWRRVPLDDPALTVTGPTHLVDELRRARFAP